MSITASERFPEEGPDFVSDDTGGLRFEPCHRRPRTTVIGDLALYGAHKNPGDLVDAPWWDGFEMSDASLVNPQASMADPREPWERRAFQMRFDDPETPQEPEENPEV